MEVVFPAYTELAITGDNGHPIKIALKENLHCEFLFAETAEQVKNALLQSGLFYKGAQFDQQSAPTEAPSESEDKPKAKKAK